MSAFIYALSDPQTGDTRYVGKANDPDGRFWGHLDSSKKGSKTHCAAWIRKLSNSNLRPNLNILEKVLDFSTWQDRERFWIKTLRNGGCSLTNHTDGGDGNKGGKASEETRRKMSLAMKGKRWTQAQREKLIPQLRAIRWTEERKAAARIWRKGMNSGTKTKEHLANISKALRGRKLSEEQINKMIGRKASKQTIEKLRISHLGIRPSLESNAKRSRSLLKTYAELRSQGRIIGRKKTEDEKTKIRIAVSEIWRMRRSGLAPMPAHKKHG